MKYLSVCSGIEAATVAWHHMGWEPVAFSEIEKFPSAVLAHHYPSVPNWGDMIKFQEWPDANIDVLVGGTPCQSFSVAGLRKGLDDPRGNLMLTYLAIAKRYRPKWLVWENVPGVLSSAGGRDFAALLRGLDELGYGWAYRVLDAQFFGVAQRRRRVFVVGHLGNWQRAAAVLFERHSLSGHPAPSRQARKGTAGGVAAGVDSGRWWDGGDVAATIPYDLYQITAPVNRQNRKPGDPCHTLARDNAAHAAVAIQGTLIGRGENAGPQGSGADVSGAMFTLTKTDVHAVAFAQNQVGEVRTGEVLNTLNTNSNASGRNTPMVQAAMQVRRLTPSEAESLQGFPRGYTNIPWRGKPESPDGPRYKALGNSMAVPCMVWIGERINEVSKL